MIRRVFGGVAGVALSMIFAAAIGWSQPALPQPAAGPVADGGNGGAEPCTRSPICADGWTGGVSAVAINSRKLLFVFKRTPAGNPRLLEFDKDQRPARVMGKD